MNWFVQSFGPRYLQLYAHRDLREAEAVVDLLHGDSSLEGRRMLDLACGAGRYLAQLQARGAAAIGVDLSTALLARARRVARTGSLVRADMRRLPLRTGAVETTWCMFTSFGYFDSRDAHRELAAEMARVSGREIVLDLPDPQSLQATLVPASERHVTGFRVEERRWLEEDPLRVCKTMRWVDEESGEERERYEERVMLFDRDEIAAFFAPVGFRIGRAFSDYAGTSFAPGRGPRLLLQLTREAP